MQWPDLSSYGIKLIAVAIPSGAKRLLFVNGHKFPAAMKRLGFAPNKNNLWFSTSNSLAIDKASLIREFPRMFVRDMQPNEILSRIGGNTKPVAGEVQARVAAMQTKPLGLNYLGEEVFENNDSRYVIRDGKPLAEQANELSPVFLRVRKDIDEASLFDDMMLCSDGLIRSIVNGKTIHRDGINEFISTLTEGRDDLDATKVHDAISASMYRSVAEKGAWDEEAFEHALRLHEGMPPLDNDSEKSVVPMPLGIVAQRLLGIQGSDNPRVLATIGRNGSLASALPMAVPYDNDIPLASGFEDTGEGADVDYTLGGFYGLWIPQEKFKGSPFTRSDHLESMRMLDRRNAKGRSAFIIGTDDEAEGKVGPESRKFFEYLSGRYELESVVELDGALFGKAGVNTNRYLVIVGDRRAGRQDIPSDIEVVRDYDRLWQWAGQELHKRGVQEVAPKEHDENSFQSSYVAMSQVSESTAKIPRNLVGPTRKALARIKAQHGDIDLWVADKLQYDVSELGFHYSSPQIDAIALAIFAIENGRGFIEGDQTGMGKGRVLAAMARYAALNQIPTVFLSEKPNLFSDFYRDLVDTGSEHIFNVAMINEGVPILDQAGNRAQRGMKKEEIEKIIDYGIEHGELMPEYNLYEATYSQFNRHKDDSKKSQWLGRVTSRALLIMDEAHNAAGDSNTYENANTAVTHAWGVVYSSATFAKQANNFKIYKRALPASVDVNSLPDTMQRGGEPLQEIFSSMLAESGVFVRRELDLSNIIFSAISDTENLERNTQLADQFAEIVEAMCYLGGEINKFIGDHNNAIKETLKKAKTDPKGKRAAKVGLFSTNFGSKLYGITRQLSLVLKADLAASSAIKALEEGRKPVLVVSNTMEAPLVEFIEDNAYYADAEGDDDDNDSDEGFTMKGEVQERVLDEPATFRILMHRMLERMMTVTEHDGKGKKIRRKLEEDYMLEAKEAISMLIDAYPDLPISALDIIRDKIEAAGYSCAEASGRKVGITEREDGTFAVIKANPLPRSRVINDFNNGLIDSTIISPACNSGVSMHAGEKFEDQRQRELFELQIDNNVATRLQFFGRVGRFGEVVPSRVTSTTTGLPFELRTLSMQNGKLRKLSANTTSNRDNASLDNDVLDILNEVGNLICYRWLKNNPHMVRRLGINPARIKEEEEDIKLLGPTFYADQVTSRVCMLKVAEQEQVYKDINTEYRAYIQDMQNKGRDPFKSTEYNWNARIVNRTVFEGAESPTGEYDSPFDVPVYLTDIEFSETINPPSSKDIKEEIENNLKALYDDERLRDTTLELAFTEILEGRRERLLERARSEAFPDVSAALASEKDNAVKSQNARINLLCGKILPNLTVGSIVEFTRGLTGKLTTGVVTKLVLPDEGSEHLLGQYDLTITIPGENWDYRTTVWSLADDETFKIHHPDSYGDFLSEFDKIAPGEVKYTRTLLDGNLFSAAEISAIQGVGSSCIYTDQDGIRQRGILLPQSQFDHRMAMTSSIRITNAAEATFLLLASMQNRQFGGVISNSSLFGRAEDSKKEMGRGNRIELGYYHTNAGQKFSFTANSAKVGLGGQMAKNANFRALVRSELSHGHHAGYEIDPADLEKAIQILMNELGLTFFAKPNARDLINGFRAAQKVENTLPALAP